MTPLIERLLPLLAREGLKVVHLIKEDSSVVFKNVFFEPTLENLSSSLSGADLVLTENFGADAPNKIEILRKYWSETPLSDEKDLIAVFADFPYHAETTLPVFDLNKPKILSHSSGNIWADNKTRNKGCLLAASYKYRSRSGIQSPKKTSSLHIAFQTGLKNKTIRCNTISQETFSIPCFLTYFSHRFFI